MKSQKLGLVLGMNMAVACLVFQGCKVTQPGAGNVPPPPVDTTITADETATPEPVVSTATTEPSSTPVASPAIEIASVTEQPVIEPLPASQVTTVKPLPVAKKPASVSAPAVEPAGAASVVVVQRGDTLSAICARNHVKMSAVVAANPGLNPNRIRVGQRIALPGGVVASAPAAKSAKVMNASAPAPVAASTKAPAKTKPSFKSYEGPTKEYKVRSGDMLGKIAYANGITVRALKEMNKLASDNLKVGQVILVPAEKVVAVKSTKSAGKGVKQPAKKSADVKKPAAAVAEEAKQPAEVPPPVAVADPVQAPVVEPAAPAATAEPVSAAPVVDAAAPAPAATPAEAAPVQSVPVAAAPDTAASDPVDAAPAPVSSMTYTVKEGDDIVGVAIAWGISPSQLMDLNNLKAGEAITPGQVLKLPANAKR